jgi:hypothetical protein
VTATPLAAATDRSWGGRSAFIPDPEGNRFWSPRATSDARVRCCIGAEPGDVAASFFRF